MYVRAVNSTPATNVSLRIAPQFISLPNVLEKYLTCLAFSTAPATKQASAILKDIQFKAQKATANALAAPGCRELPQHKRRVTAASNNWLTRRDAKAPTAKAVAMSEE